MVEPREGGCARIAGVGWLVRGRPIVLAVSVVAMLVPACGRGVTRERATSPADVPVVAVRIATDGPIDDEHVSLTALPAGYVPAVGQDRALALAADQLGSAAAPSGAIVYLGTGVEGFPVWVVTYEGVCGVSDLRPTAGGPSGPGGCVQDTPSIALDAETGDSPVAW